MMEPTTFAGAIQKVSTLADGGIRVTFDMNEGAVMQAAELMEIRQGGFAVRVEVTPIEFKDPVVT